MMYSVGHELFVFIFHLCIVLYAIHNDLQWLLKILFVIFVILKTD